MRKVLLSLGLLLATPAVAQTADSAPAADPAMASGGKTVPVLHPMQVGGNVRSISLETGAGRIMTLPGGAANIFIADPKIVEVRPASASSLFMFGIAPGRTTVAAMDGAGHLVSQFEVVIKPSGYGGGLAAEAIGHALPGSRVKVDTTTNSIVLSGRVKDAAEAERAQSIAASYAPKGVQIDNRLTVASSIQVGLRVRIVEMSRTLTRALGLQWQTIGTLGTFATTPGISGSAIASLTLGSRDLNAVLDALSQDNLVRTLAEPNLVTQSGENASFLAGGQFPIPVSQGIGAVSVTYQSYGVQLSFVPTVMSDDSIVLHVHPEVSDISSANAISISSGSGAAAATNATQVIPALTVRRADTTVQLGSGQSFAIAGLLQDNVNHSVSALPFLGDVPILGALFRSDSFQRAQTELVIVVTPYIVKPISRPQDVRMPDENYVAPNDIDRYLRLRQIGEKITLPAHHPTTANGFIVE